jgi:hypothetical protein
MDRSAFAFVSLATLCAVTPAFAQNAAAFDGTYAGVSITVERTTTTGRCFPPANPVPGTLTVAAGVAKTPAATGTVSPQGSLILRDNQSGSMRQGQIDSQGNATVKFTGTDCLLTYVWRKSGR